MADLGDCSKTQTCHKIHKFFTIGRQPILEPNIKVWDHSDPHKNHKKFSKVKNKSNKYMFCLYYVTPFKRQS